MRGPVMPCVQRLQTTKIQMIVLINGSFGVGKTTVASLLRAALLGSVVYDPEWAGLLLMRLPSWLRLRGAGTDDFQDLALWRRSVVAGTRVARAVASGPVIVPMAFTRLDYLTEIVSGMRQFEPAVKVFCLRASETTIRRRLDQRGTSMTGPQGEWIARRVAECVGAHEDPRFGEAVETENRDASQVVNDFLERL